MKNTALILGAGFSRQIGLPQTNELTNHFLDLAPTGPTPLPVQSAITKCLRKFWEEVFHYSDQAPSFEDHFTVLDLAANSGHHLGRLYSPKKLRAIRRFSIHRIFDIIEQAPVTDVEPMGCLLEVVAADASNAVISTNWDIVVESRLREAGAAFHYGIRVEPLSGSTNPADPAGGLILLKLHGSSNWLYCDSCYRVFGGDADLKTALYRWAYLEPGDFETMGVAVDPALFSADRVQCRYCGVSLGARLATFSYEKGFDQYQFQATWAAALQRLQVARDWIFIGYSLPEADFQLRHMLKTAELSTTYGHRPTIHVVLKGDAEVPRYKRFFGLTDADFSLNGLNEWIKTVPECNRGPRRSRHGA